MSQRIEEIAERTSARLVGKKIEAVEMRGDPTHGGDGLYIVLQIEGELTLYASNPALYVPVEEPS